MISKKKISVVVCAKNEERQIKECLEKIKACNPDEIILVDGNSKDATVAIGERYVDQVIRSVKTNLTSDRQCGIDLAKNEFIAMIDADHRLNKDSIE